MARRPIDGRAWPWNIAISTAFLRDVRSAHLVARAFEPTEDDRQRIGNFVQPRPIALRRLEFRESAPPSSVSPGCSTRDTLPRLAPRR